MTTSQTALSPNTILEAIERLDPMPMSVTRLLELNANENAGLEEISEVVKFDPVLSADVLQKANSPMYGGRESIVDVPQAVGRLGAADVLYMAMVRTMSGRMSASLPPYGFDANELWHHSLTASIAAEEIARLSNRDVPPGSGIAALIHDVGKLVIANTVPASVMMRVRAMAKDTGRPMHELELEAIGTTHADIGGTIARHWGFPLSVQIAIVGHHTPPQNEDPLSAVVRAANAVTHGLDAYDLDPKTGITQVAADIVQNAGVHVKDVVPVYARTLEALADVLFAYN
jgi:HD-like signal output (HDOD) protein